MTWLQTGAMHLVGHEEVLKGYLLCIHNSLNTAGTTMTFKKTLKYIKRNTVSFRWVLPRTKVCSKRGICLGEVEMGSWRHLVWCITWCSEVEIVGKFATVYKFVTNGPLNIHVIKINRAGLPGTLQLFGTSHLLIITSCLGEGDTYVPFNLCP